MTLVVLSEAHLAFGALPLLDGATLSIEEGQRIGLIGRNGTGKSSLLGAIAGRVALDDGEIRRRDGLRVATVEQEPELPEAATIKESLLARAHAAHLDDDRDRWRLDTRLAEFLHRFGLAETLSPAEASGGEAKRAALALAFALEPDLLLLDEPTNHLDIDAIATLESLAVKGPAMIVVTHDRAFLDRVATRIVELDRGALRAYPGNYAAWERAKASELEAEAVANRKFDKFWAQEEAWIRKGIEARRTRNEGRVRRLESLRNARSARRERAGSIKLAIDAGELKTGKVVAELQGVGKSFGGRPIVKDLDFTLRRGDRLGLIGPNGAGKTTLVKILLGELAPDTGTVKTGTNVIPAYFDQMREQLDPERTVAETISPGSEWIEVGGSRKHITGYLAEFLFPPRRAQSPVRMLSGGERNRLLLARLFAKPANVLVLDEPTNDLDIESLELLEEALSTYAGTLVLVSHDRAFLDNVVTQSLVAEGEGRWKEYVGGYSDWLSQRPAPAAAAKPAEKTPPAPSREKARVKLSYKEQRELDALPGEIEALEAEQRALGEKMSHPDWFKAGGDAMRADQQRHDALDEMLLQKMERWEALESKSNP